MSGGNKNSKYFHEYNQPFCNLHMTKFYQDGNKSLKQWKYLHGNLRFLTRQHVSHTHVHFSNSNLVFGRSSHLTKENAEMFKREVKMLTFVVWFVVDVLPSLLLYLSKTTIESYKLWARNIEKVCSCALVARNVSCGSGLLGTGAEEMLNPSIFRQCERTCWLCTCLFIYLHIFRVKS